MCVNIHIRSIVIYEKNFFLKEFGVTFFSYKVNYLTYFFL